MPIRYRAAATEPATLAMTNIQPPNKSWSDITAPGSGGGDHALPTATSLQVAISSTDTAVPSGLVTETGSVPTTSRSLPLPTQIFTSTTAPVTKTPTPTHTPAASHGLSPTKLALAVIIPIAFLAILIPILVFWVLGRRRKLQEQRDASQRHSHSREPMIQKLREPIIERQPSYKGPAPARPLRTPAGKRSPRGGVQEPLSAHTRDSLGLFNFELSPTTPKTPKVSRTPESETSPQFRFSVARALEMRRSQPSVVQPHARTSDTRVSSNISATEAGRPGTRGSNRGSGNSLFDPPPPYASPRPSESAAERSHFAPLSRIGTRNLADRSPPQAPAPVHPSTLSEEPDRSTYASSDAIQDRDTHAQVRTRSSSPSLEWPSPPRPQGVLARKPVPSQAARVVSHSTSPHDDSHLDGPFEPYLPERLSDVSGFSIDTSRWGGEDRSRQESTVSSMHSVRSLHESDDSTVQPRHLV
jgi:hypothetical protein